MSSRPAALAAASPPKITEAQFLDQLINAGPKRPGLAIVLGWEVVHFRPARTAYGWRTAVQGTLGAGWPDLVLARGRDGRLKLRELKRDGEAPSPEQRRVLAVLGACGLDVGVWRPADLEAIAAELR